MAGKARTATENATWQEGRLAPNMAGLCERFGDEAQCEEYLISLKHPGGFACASCGHAGYKKVGGRREYRCTGCGRQFSATVGTVLEGTKLPLTKWFRAAWMVASDTRGASAQAVARECGVSDVTGLSMLRRPGTAMGFAMALCKVGGEWVEADGAHVACGNDGSSAGRPGSGGTDAPVLVAVSATRCVIRAASDSNGGSMAEFASAHVSRNHEVRCDEHGANLALLGGWDVRMRASAADGDSEESLPAVHHVISNFKSWLAGTFHGAGVGRLQEYADDFSWRYSHRSCDAFADLLREVARWPHVPLSLIRGCRVAMPPHEPPAEPGRKHNEKLRERWRKKERERAESDVREVPDVIPADLLPLIGSAFDFVEMMMDEDLVAA